MAVNFITVTNSPTDQYLAQNYLTMGPTQASDIVRGDSEVEFSIQPVVENPAGSATVFSPDFDDSDVLTMGIGNPDEPPTGGTISLTANGSSTGLTAIGYNITAAALTTAFNVAIAAGGGGSATALCLATLVDDGVFLLTGTTNQLVATGFFAVTSAANLFPLSTGQFSEESLGSASTPYRILFSMTQQAMCFATATDLIPDADVTLSTVQSGGADSNRIQKILFSEGAYGGTATFSATADGTTATCGTVTPGMSQDALGAVLAQHEKINYNDPDGEPNNIAPSVLGYGEYNVEFIGTLKNSAANLLILSNQSVIGPRGKTGSINYNTVGLLLYSYTQTQNPFKVKRQIQRTKASGEVRTIYIDDVSIDKSILNPATAVPTPASSYYTAAQVDALLLLKQSILWTVTTATSTFSFTSSHQTVQFTSGTFDATLASAVGMTGKIFVAKNSGSGVITLKCGGGQLIDGSATQTLVQYDCLWVQSDGANWMII